VEQELWVDLVSRWRRFDATRAGCHTFAARVVEHQATRLFHRSQAVQQDAERNGRSLEDPVIEEAGQSVPLSQTLDDGVQRLRDGHPRRAAQVQFELAADVATVLANLPAELRDLCERLKESSIADVARDLGVRRTSVYRRIERVRAHFVAAGLHEYFGISADTFPSARVCNVIGDHNNTELNGCKEPQITPDR
jgi:RNA polymerase sigma-70 factor (ECF subfamily)